MRIVLALIACLSISACSHPQPGIQNLKAWNVTPFPQPTDSIRTYPASDAFSKNGPRLSSVQRAWILRATESRSYAHVPLRFALLEGVKTPVVVYADVPGFGGVHRGGHVIGEACQVWFDPVGGTVYAASEAACSPPTPKPED